MKTRISMAAMAVLAAICVMVIPVQSYAAVANGVDYDSSYDYDETDGTQPDGQWSYGTYNGTASWGSFTQLPEINSYGVGDTGGDFMHWTDSSAGYPKIGEFFIHPDNSEWAVKRWTSDVTGTIEIDYDIFNLRDYSDNKDLYITHNGTPFSLADGNMIALSGSEQHAGTLTANVTAGDVIDFCIDEKASNAGDWTHLWARIRATHLRPTALPTGLVMHWSMDTPDDVPTGYNNRYNNIMDVSGNNRHGVLDYVDYDERVDGLMGNAIDLDGGDDMMSMNAAFLAGATQLTISVWAKTDSMDNWDGIVTLDSTTGMYYAKYNQSYYDVYSRIMGSSTGSSTTSIRTSAGSWAHMVLVWQSGVIHRIYINGREGMNNDASAYVGSISSSTLRVGRDRTYSDRMYDGMLDDLTIWTNALTEAQIGEIYNLGIHGWDASYLNNEPTGNDIDFLPYTTGLKVWLDSSDVDGQNNSTLSDGTNITTWINKAGGAAGNAVTARNSTRGGEFKTSIGAKGNDCIRLNGTSDAFMLSEFMSSDTFSIFAVVKNTGGDSGRRLFSDYGDPASRTLGFSTSNGSLTMRDPTNHTFTPAANVGSQLANNDWKTVEAHLSVNGGGGYTVEVGEKGNTVTQTDTGFAATTWQTGADTRYTPHIGCNQPYYNETPNSFFGGDICEILIYDHAVTGDDRTAIENYLYNKYWTLGTMIIIN